MNLAITAALIAAQNSHPPSPVGRLTKAGAVSDKKAIVIDTAAPAERKQLDQAIKLGLILRRGDACSPTSVRWKDATRRSAISCYSAR